MAEFFPWEEIAISDQYRNADPFTRWRVQMDWLQNVANPAFGGQLTANPQAMQMVMRQFQDSNLPPVADDEPAIIPPSALHRDGFVALERNPAFARKTYQEQQELRHVWAVKTAALDPAYRSMSPQEQMNFMTDVMRRPPASSVSATLGGSVAPVYNVLSDAFESSPPVLQAGQAYLGQAIQSYVGSAGGLIIGPARWLIDKTMGKDANLLGSFMDDMNKAVQWSSARSNATNPIPSFIGSVLGFAVGPTPKLEKALAGGMRASVVGGKLVNTAVPGLLEKAGLKAGLKLPSLTYGVVGGATTGALHGIGQAIAEDKPWNTYLPQDLSLGVAFEFVTRYAGAAWAARKALKAAGFDGTVKEFMNAPFQVGGADLPKQMLDALAANNLTKHTVRMEELVDPNGLIWRNWNSPKGAKLAADVLGYQLVENGPELSAVKNGEVMQRWTLGDMKTKYRQASQWLDAQDVEWSRIATGKSFHELAQATRTVELREGVRVPEQARTLIKDTLEQHAIQLPFRYDADPQHDARIIDTIYSILKSSKDTSETTKILRARGLDFSSADTGAPRPSAESNVEMLRYKLEQLDPKRAFFIYDSQTHTVVKPSEVPELLVDHPLITDPQTTTKLWTGPISKLRDGLSKLKRLDSNVARAETVLTKSHGITLKRNDQTHLLELSMRIPDANNELMDVSVFFRNRKEASKFMRGSGTGVFQDIFGNDPGLKESFNQYDKKMWKTDRRTYDTEFIPFKFLAKQARDEGYFLGTFKGKYIIEDAVGNTESQYRQFNSLREVATWLKENDPRTVLDPTIDIAEAAAERLDIDTETFLNAGKWHEFADPALQKEATTKHFGLGMRLEMATMPTQNVMASFERLPFAKLLHEKGVGPVQIHGAMRDSTTAANLWQRPRVQRIHALSKGFDEDMASYAVKWWESVEDNAERVFGTTELNLRRDVEAEMLKRFGVEKTQKIMDTTREISDMLSEIFTAAGLDPKTYIKYYMPHLRAEMAKLTPAAAQSIGLRKALTHIPNQNRKAFIEMLREADPQDYARETNIFRLANTYVHVAARKKWITPVLEHIANRIKQAAKDGALKGALDSDYAAFTNYVADLFDAVSGIPGMDSRLWSRAAEGTLDTLKAHLKPLEDAFDKITKKPPSGRPKLSKSNIIDRVIALPVGAYISARPISVAKQLTQSLITGLPLIGPRAWMAGLDATMRPGSIQELIQRGVFEAEQLPVGSGYALRAEGPITSAVRMGMKPYQWGDWVNRAIIYYGMSDRVDRAIQRYLTTGNKARMLREAGADLFGSAHYNEALARLSAKGPEAFKDYLSKLATNKTQFLYEKFEHPTWFRSGVGKLFGMFTTFPINMLSMVKSIVAVDSLPWSSKLRILGTLSTVGYSIALGFRAAGVRSDDLYPWNSVMFQGGPYYQMMNDMLGALNGNKQRWRSFTRALTGLVPFSRAGEGVYKAVASIQRGDMYEAFLHLASAPIIQYNGGGDQIETPLDQLEGALNAAGDAFFAAKQNVETFGGALQ